MVCFVAYAPLRKRFAFVAGNDVEHSFAIPRRDAPELCRNHPPETEGVGNAGCPMHPQMG